MNTSSMTFHLDCVTENYSSSHSGDTGFS